MANRPSKVRRRAEWRGAREICGTETTRDARKRKAAKSVKPVKVIRDSFTIPAAEHRLIGALKKRCIGLGVAIKKRELLRAGLAVLVAPPR